MTLALSCALVSNDLFACAESVFNKLGSDTWAATACNTGPGNPGARVLPSTVWTLSAMPEDLGLRMF